MSKLGQLERAVIDSWWGPRAEGSSSPEDTVLACQLLQRAARGTWPGTALARQHYSAAWKLVTVIKLTSTRFLSWMDFSW